MLSNILAIATLFLTVSANPVAQGLPNLPPPTGSNYAWAVTGWTAKCTSPQTNGDCRWSFDLKGNELTGYNPNVPGFTAHCAGSKYVYTDGVSGPEIPCALTDGGTVRRRVTSNLWNPPDGAMEDGVTLRITYQFESPDGATWNYTARDIGGLDGRPGFASDFHVRTILFERSHSPISDQ
ncbi:hypothetical protein HYFRA_00006510 [Hymenoscyphus fraxineus]|uniref:Uncharacterized protein n=1 Tax=Hymenoscyphus fraxineus TaxID=746836 RepID=A0A9N9PR41_9HELO|nr:hypothetical protein HYFRA_00006510 [Hymenoscyphus fraxineus]